MDTNNDFRLEGELLGSESGRESAGEWSCHAPQETAAKETKKRRSEPTMKIEENRKTGPKGKAGDGLAGRVRSL